MSRLASILAFLFLLASCRTGSVEDECRFPGEPVVVRTVGNAVLQYWELEDAGVWTSTRLPDDSAYVRYREQIEKAGADEMRPAQVVPEAEKDSAYWERELRNVELAYGEHGHVRPINCLEALLFAKHQSRSDQIETPTEFLASILRKEEDGRALLRVYFGGGDTMFPPNEVYGLDEAGLDVDGGWRYVAMLHNHTIQRMDGRLRLGVPAPSVNDVQLLRSLVADHGLESARVTNGLYTVEISAEQLEHYLGPE